MMTMTCLRLNIYFRWFNDRTTRNDDYVWITLSRKAYGAMYTGGKVKPAREYTPETLMTALRFIRTMRADGKGEIVIDGIDDYSGPVYRAGILSELFRNKEEAQLPAVRRHVECPVTLAILDYIEGGDEADLMGAIDMLTDAGKFDNA